MATGCQRSGLWPPAVSVAVCGRSLAGVAGSNPAGGMDGCHEFVWCQVEVSALG